MSEQRTLVVAGASGVVGRHLLAQARAQGYTLRVLTTSGRSPAGVEAFQWDPTAVAMGTGGALEQVRKALEGADLLVNLAGAGVADGRLDKAHKSRVLGSRLDATNALVKAHEQCEAPPGVWIQASAVGFYGDTGETDVTEATPRGPGFLADVCIRWESAARVLASKVRLIVARFGVVFATDAPAWQKLLGPILWGVGGPLGHGRQWWAWIDADDLARALLFLSASEDAEGIYNLTAPEPVRQGDLARQIGIVVGRPVVFPVPAFVLRLALGEVADALLLPSCRALPTRLLRTEFRFEKPTIGRELISLFEDVE